MNSSFERETLGAAAKRRSWTRIERANRLWRRSCWAKFEFSRLQAPPFLPSVLSARFQPCKSPQLPLSQAKHSPAWPETKGRDTKNGPRVIRERSEKKRRQLSSSANWEGNVSSRKSVDDRIVIIEKKKVAAFRPFLPRVPCVSLLAPPGTSLASRASTPLKRPPQQASSDDGEPAPRLERERRREREEKEERTRKREASIESPRALPTPTSTSLLALSLCYFSLCCLSSLAPLGKQKRRGAERSDSFLLPRPPRSSKRAATHASLSPRPLSFVSQKERKLPLAPHENEKRRKTPPPRQRQRQPWSNSASTWLVRAARLPSGACSRRRLGFRPSLSTLRRSGCASASLLLLPPPRRR